MEKNKYELMRQRNNSLELDIKIRNCHNDINVSKNKMKSFKKWAIIPPILIMSCLFLGTGLINNIFVGSAMSIADLFAACKGFLLAPIAVSAGFPAFYGLQYYASREELKKQEQELTKLENFKQMNEKALETAKKDYDETQDLYRDSESNRRALLEAFYEEEKEKLKELYNSGKFEVFINLGWSVSDIIYLKDLVEEDMRLVKNRIGELDQGISLTRNKPKDDSKN